MVSKMVTDRQKLCEDLLAWANANAPALEKGLVAALGKDAPKTATIVGIARHAEGGLSALVAADEVHTQEQTDDVIPRETRDAASKGVADLLVSLRRAVESGYGRAGLLVLGIHERQNYDPVVVERVGKRVIDVVSAEGFKMPAGNPDVTVDVASFVAKIKVAHAELATALKTVDKEAAELVGTQAAKDAAMVAFGDRFNSSAMTLRGLATMAGRADLAEGLPLFKGGGGGGGGGGGEEPGEEPTP